MSLNSKLETIKFLTLEELSRLLDAISDKRDKTFFLIGCRHGPCASKIGLLQIQDLDFERH
jgi:integrase